MSTLKAIQYRLPRTRWSSPEKFSSRLGTIICLSNPQSPDSNSSNPDGDKRKQELLAQIVMLQAQKVRLTDFIEDRSAHLSQLAEDANAEVDAIGEQALKDLDDAGTRILEKLESRIESFEESEEKNQQDNQKALLEFEEQMARDRNEGLFFKSLQKGDRRHKAVITEEVENMRQGAKDTARSGARRNIYLALISLMILAVCDSLFGSPEVEWRKVGALSLILAGLLAQFVYEQRMSSTTGEKKKEK